MPHLRSSRELQLEQAAAVCGWFPQGKTRGPFCNAAEAVWTWGASPAQSCATRVPALLDKNIVVLVEQSSRNLFEAFGETLDALADSLSRMSARTPAEKVIDSYLAEVRTLHGVEAVLARTENDQTRLWTVLAEHDRAVEDAVFEAERHALETDPEVMVDFRVLYRHGQPLEDVRPAGATILGG